MDEGGEGGVALLEERLEEGAALVAAGDCCFSRPFPRLPPTPPALLEEPPDVTLKDLQAEGEGVGVTT